VEINLNHVEQQLLLEILGEELKDLRVEVRRTGTPEFHDNLKRREKLLENVIAKLESMHG